MHYILVARHNHLISYIIDDRKIESTFNYNSFCNILLCSNLLLFLKSSNKILRDIFNQVLPGIFSQGSPRHLQPEFSETSSTKALLPIVEYVEALIPLDGKNHNTHTQQRKIK